MLSGRQLFRRTKLRIHLLHGGDSIAYIYADKASNNEIIEGPDFETDQLVDTIFSYQVKTEKDSLPVTFNFFEDFAFSPDVSKLLIQTQIEPLYYSASKEFNFILEVCDARMPISIQMPVTKFLFFNDCYPSNIRENTICLD